MGTWNRSYYVFCGLWLATACAGADPMDGSMGIPSPGDGDGTGAPSGNDGGDDGGSGDDGGPGTDGDDGGTTGAGDDGGTSDGGTTGAGDDGGTTDGGDDGSGTTGSAGPGTSDVGSTTGGPMGGTTTDTTDPDAGTTGATCPPLGSCAAQPVVGVTAIGDDGNVPDNVNDGNMGTRWSFEGAGAWIVLDLGSVRSLCDVGIAWFRGDERTSDFSVQVSLDGQIFSTAFTGQSSGTTAGMETYTLAGGPNGRYVRIEVAGNSQNEWASISEISVAGRDGAGPGCGGGTTTGDTTTAGDTGSTGGGGACASGPPEDQNGVAYIDLPGFTYVGGVERFDWNENFKGNGSMRHDFEGTREGNQCVLGYFVVDGPDDEEFSAKLGGGPHSDSNSDWADTHDVAIANFAGDRARIRWEATHPSYDSGPSVDINVGDLRNKWVGVMGCKLNLDNDGDSEIDHIWYIAWVDLDGLDGAGDPSNGWIKTLDLEIHVDDVELKSPEIPYVETIGEGDEAQATMRIDEQDSSYEYKFVAYRSPVACPP